MDFKYFVFFPYTLVALDYFSYARTDRWAHGLKLRANLHYEISAMKLISWHYFYHQFHV